MADRGEPAPASLQVNGRAGFARVSIGGRGPQAGPKAAVIGGALGLLLALILAIAAVAATVIGLLVALAAVVTRFAPRQRGRSVSGPPLLEGKATADGWVAEPSSSSSR